jgi:hypothetical protein
MRRGLDEIARVHALVNDEPMPSAQTAQTPVNRPQITAIREGAEITAERAKTPVG